MTRNTNMRRNSSSKRKKYRGMKMGGTWCQIRKVNQIRRRKGRN